MTDTPKRPAHRPQEMEEGKRRNIYIDAESWEAARELGGGNGSEGIRKAIKIATGAA